MLSLLSLVLLTSKPPRESSKLPINALSLFGQQLYLVLLQLKVEETDAIVMAIALLVDHVPPTIFASGIIHNHLQVTTSLQQVRQLASHSQLLILTTLCSLDLSVEELGAVNQVKTVKLETVVEPHAKQVLLSHQPKPSLLLERPILIFMTLK